MTTLFGTKVHHADTQLNVRKKSPSLVILDQLINVQHTKKTPKGADSAPRTGIGLSGKILGNIKCFFLLRIFQIGKIRNNIFFKFGKFAIEKDRFLFQSYSKFEIHEKAYLSNLLEKKQFKKSFFIFQNITALPYSRPGGGGGRIGHSGDFSCAAHLLIDLRSPNLVTFPDVILLILRLFM